MMMIEDTVGLLERFKGSISDESLVLILEAKYICRAYSRPEAN